MIKNADARCDVGKASSVKIKADVDNGFSGFAFNFCGAGHDALRSSIPFPSQ